MINLVIPMAGRGSRFSKQGYTLPKPLVELDGKPFFGGLLSLYDVALKSAS